MQSEFDHAMKHFTEVGIMPHSPKLPQFVLQLLRSNVPVVYAEDLIQEAVVVRGHTKQDM